MRGGFYKDPKTNTATRKKANWNNAGVFISIQKPGLCKKSGFLCLFSKTCPAER